MPYTPKWMEPILQTHPTRNYSFSLSDYASHPESEAILRGPHGKELEKLFDHKPKEKKELKRLWQAIENARPKNTLERYRGGYEEKLEKAVSEWTAYLRSRLANNPKIRKRFIGYLVNRVSSDQTGIQVTWSGRHRQTDMTLHEVLTQHNIQPTSFLEVGAAFNSYGRELPDQLSPVYETKKFFDGKGITMHYTAADITEMIDKVVKPVHRARGITPITWDYRKNPLYQTQGVVKKFSVIRMANVSRHQSPEEFQKTLKVLFESLEPNGILVIKNDGGNIHDTLVYHDEVFYQKVKQRTWTLKRIHPA